MLGKRAHSSAAGCGAGDAGSRSAEHWASGPGIELFSQEAQTPSRQRVQGDAPTPATRQHGGRKDVVSDSAAGGKAAALGVSLHPSDLNARGWSYGDFDVDPASASAKRHCAAPRARGLTPRKVTLDSTPATSLEDEYNSPLGQYPDARLARAGAPAGRGAEAAGTPVRSSPRIPAGDAARGARGSPPRAGVAAAGEGGGGGSARKRAAVRPGPDAAGLKDGKEALEALDAREALEGVLSSAATPEDEYVVPRELVHYPVDKRFWAMVGQRFNPVREVGSGTFGTVYKAEYRGDRLGGERKTVAIKRLFAYQKLDAHAGEAAFLTALHGQPNIAQLLDLEGARGGVLLAEEQQALVFDYFEHDRASEYVRDFDVPELRRFMRNLFLALRAVHARGFIHRDVKHSNFLYRRNARTDGEYLLIDFGLAEKRGLECTPPGACEPPDAPTDDARERRAAHGAGGAHRAAEQVSGAGRSKEAPRSMMAKKSNGRVQLPHASGAQRAPRPAHRKPAAADPRRARRVPVANRGGTRGCRPPEVLMHSMQQTTAVDMWSAGVVMLNILCRRTQFPMFTHPDDRTALLEINCLRQYVASMDDVWDEAAQRYTGERRHKLRDVARAFSLDVEVDWADIDANGGCLGAARAKGHTWRTLCSHFSAQAGGESYAHLSDEHPVFHLLGRLLDVDPRTRISAEQALRHPFLRPDGDPDAPIPAAAPLPPEPAAGGTPLAEDSPGAPPSGSASPWSFAAAAAAAAAAAPRTRELAGKRVLLLSSASQSKLQELTSRLHAAGATVLHFVEEAVDLVVDEGHVRAAPPARPAAAAPRGGRAEKMLRAAAAQQPAAARPAARGAQPALTQHARRVTLAELEALLARDEKAAGVVRPRPGAARGGARPSPGLALLLASSRREDRSGSAPLERAGAGVGAYARGEHVVAIGGDKTTFSRSGGTPEWWHELPDAHPSPGLGAGAGGAAAGGDAERAAERARRGGKDARDERGKAGRSGFKPKASRSGYCYLCHVHYENYYAHTAEKKHLQVAAEQRRKQEADARGSDPASA